MLTMLDHVFTDAIGALRDAVESAFLERQAFEERFQSDFLLGDLTWETSYSLPGEGAPPRTRADLSLDWPTWSQTAYRSWYIGEPTDEPPRIEIEITFRVQRLAASPDPAEVLGVLPELSASVGSSTLERSGPTIEVWLPIKPTFFPSSRGRYNSVWSAPVSMRDSPRVKLVCSIATLP